MSSPTAANVLTVAHLSDPHLTTLEGVKVSALLNKRILGYLSWWRRRRHVHDPRVLAAIVDDLVRAHPDHVAVTGDLTHIGLPQECAEADRWLRLLARTAPVSVVLGNHDRYTHDRTEATVGLWREFVGERDREGSPVLRRFGAIALIGVDSAVVSPPFFATGRVGTEQLDALSRMLAECGEAGFFRLVAMHHSPLPDGHSWRKRLTDAAALMAVLERHGAELVIHGHGHVERLDVVETGRGTMLVLGAPSASYRKDGRAGWNRYDISAAERGWRVRIETRRWHEQDGVRTGTIVEHRVGARA